MPFDWSVELLGHRRNLIAPLWMAIPSALISGSVVYAVLGAVPLLIVLLLSLTRKISPDNCT